MYTIGQLAKECNLSRSTLLYYDSLGLFGEINRTAASYRIFTEKDRCRLEQICLYRSAGLSLEVIKKLLADPQSKVEVFIKKRICDIGAQISFLQNQQKQAVKLLLDWLTQSATATIDKNAWWKLFEDAGFEEYDQWEWHHDFEVKSPEIHEQFLRRLELSEEEIKGIRVWAKEEY